MQVSSANDVKIYSLTAGKSLPDWIEDRAKRRKKSEAPGYSSSAIQLIQDFDMPVISNRVSVSRDERYIVALGTYKPRMKCYDVRDLGMKFERCFDSEAVAFEYLSDDYSKLLFLHCDRYVSLHAQFGYYYKLRVPKAGRDLVYLRHACEAHFCGDGADVYRLNLEQGRFMAPYALATPTGGNVIVHNEETHLTCIGTANGTVEAWDPRSHERVGTLDCAHIGGEDAPTGGAVQEITALEFRDPLTLGVGTSAGFVSLFDLRSTAPLITKDHRYGLPIRRVRFHDGLSKVLSMDPKGIKIWDASSGESFTSIESKTDLNDFDVFPRSGLILSANEQPRLQVHYLPALGPAPRWCSFLDTITEELEETASVDVYDNYKFLTREQLEALGLDHLIGTPLLRAYMHGYFVDVRLYKKAQTLAGPVEASSSKRFVEERVRKEMAEKLKRVETKKKEKPKVNSELFERLQLEDDEGEEEDEPRKRSKKKKAREARAASLLKDDRFKSMFEDENFEIDTEEEAFRLINPVVAKMKEAKAAKKTKNVSDEESGSSDEEAEGRNGSVDNGNEAEESDSMDDGDGAFEDEQVSVPRKQKKKQKLNAEKSVSVKEVTDITSGKRSKKERMSLGSRLDRLQEEESSRVLKRHADGSHSMTFRKSHNKREMMQKKKNEEHMQERRKVGRSARALKNRKPYRS